MSLEVRVLDKESRYLKVYRARLGFQNQLAVKNFFSAKDITQKIDYTYLNSFNQRLIDMLYKLNHISSGLISEEDLKLFSEKNISNVFLSLKKQGFFEKLFSQSKKPQKIYFSWMREYIVSKFLFMFFNFGFSPKDIDIFENHFLSVEEFKSLLDLSFDGIFDGNRINISLQSSFDGKNMISENKVKSASALAIENSCPSWLIHFDVFNGMAAFKRLDNVTDTCGHWVEKSGNAGKRVLEISRKNFKWKFFEPILTEKKMSRFFR